MSIFHHTPDEDPPAPVTRQQSLADHAMGLELQLLEISERRERCVVQGDHAEAALLATQAEALQAELGEVGAMLGAA